MRSALLVLTALLAHPASACPTIATGTPSQLSFDTAQVVKQKDIPADWYPLVGVSSGNTKAQ